MSPRPAAALASIPVGRLGDRRGAALVLALGVGLLGLAYASFAAGGIGVLLLVSWFIAAIGCVETAAHAVAALAPAELRGSAFGCWRRYRAPAIWPARSPACCGPPRPLGSPSAIWRLGCCSRWSGCLRRAAVPPNLS